MSHNDALVSPLCYLFNLILNTSTYPSLWKTAKVIPVYKTVINEQHGFVKGRYTCTNLCEFSQIVLNAIANRMQVDIIYTDMTKAFDIVDHEILVCKLSRLGLCQSLLVGIRPSPLIVGFCSFVNNVRIVDLWTLNTGYVRLLVQCLTRKLLIQRSPEEHFTAAADRILFNTNSNTDKIRDANENTVDCLLYWMHFTVIIFLTLAKSMGSNYIVSEAAKVEDYVFEYLDEYVYT
ncbi:uncharacterized protein LOC135143245 [Zophobas morio]|uniref:uncharacterized protein LOC135143245 n=1 Tax=Zophobas morio TaxID=2755281 RepID=UPI0030827D5A